MTDAAAPGLTDVWNMLLAVVAREPVPLQVLIALLAIVALLMMIDGVRANLLRRKPEALAIIRDPHRSSVPYSVPQSKAAPRPMHASKRTARRIKKHKATRPRINRVPPVLSHEYEERAMQPSHVREEPPSQL
jgi:hypothetical protein